MTTATTFRPGSGPVPDRDSIPVKYRWDLQSVCSSWEEWTASYTKLDAAIGAFKTRQGTLSQGAPSLLDAFKAMDEMGALAYQVWYFAALQYDQDQRNNEINGRRQQVQILFARQQQASSWFNPELLEIPLDTIRGWMDGNADLAVYRFAIESLFHEQEHVLDEKGERLLSFAGRFGSVPHDSYAALTTADMKFPTITLASGDEVTITIEPIGTLVNRVL